MSMKYEERNKRLYYELSDDLFAIQENADSRLFGP